MQCNLDGSSYELCKVMVCSKKGCIKCQMFVKLCIIKYLKIVVSVDFVSVQFESKVQCIVCVYYYGLCDCVSCKGLEVCYVECCLLGFNGEFYVLICDILNRFFLF